MKKVVLWILILFIPIQFITVEVPKVVDRDGNLAIDAPESVISTLKRSCFDCHSDDRRYPWYSHIAPISWYVNSHIKRGLEIVNFSRWGEYSDKRKRNILERIPKAIVIRMPMPTYLWLHSDAKLSREDRDILKSWVLKKLEERLND
ncbi:MAG: heme-binding domain-containing protein [Epsilonproteobacteria bacterium]|nr:heme-binding domain-containing protein [Campylobacterota bacterium]